MEGEARKRLKHAKEVNEQEVIDGTTLEIVEKDKTETNIVGSEEMELNIAHIFEKIEHFTQMVSELQESGKAMFKEMKKEFEEGLISIHEEEMEKWQEEIEELRLLDAYQMRKQVVFFIMLDMYSKILTLTLEGLARILCIKKDK
ncbi:hypothetical protein POPTR_002G184600v4 [Populus trichocarpa]|uniref:Uncharacterized protein n=1 Tax=Populus trichocarpa TaxID=3694 RepID=B9GRV3_POPTR|nr:uncharacterized protein LOC7487766 [Populus trichocarpa]PNT50398.1 hypothetical protein POPTR_002G184600v4 [Populus trichocarpa]|eukprot:XP_002301462.1 uncharacterized protein LOC7487766 [Populus trichocarpa]